MEVAEAEVVVADGTGEAESAVEEVDGAGAADVVGGAVVGAVLGGGWVVDGDGTRVAKEDI